MVSVSYELIAFVLPFLCVASAGGVHPVIMPIGVRGNIPHRRARPGCGAGRGGFPPRVEAAIPGRDSAVHFEVVQRFA